MNIPKWNAKGATRTRHEDEERRGVRVELESFKKQLRASNFRRLLLSSATSPFFYLSTLISPAPPRRRPADVAFAHRQQFSLFSLAFVVRVVREQGLLSSTPALGFFQCRSEFSRSPGLCLKPRQSSRKPQEFTSTSSDSGNSVNYCRFPV